MRVGAALLAMIPFLCGGCKDDRAAPPRGERWAEVVAWAYPDGEPDRSDALLTAVAPFSAEEVRDQVDWYGSDDKRASLPDEVRAATARLISWSENGAPMSPAGCAEMEQTVGPWVLASLTAAQAALLLATDNPDDPLVRASLTLGHRLLTAGDNLLQAAVGGAILQANADWLEARHLAPSSRHKELLPGENVLRRVYAVEALCSLEIAEKLEPAGGAGAMRGEIEKLRAFHEGAVHAIASVSEAAAPEVLEKYAGQSPYRKAKLVKPLSSAFAGPAASVHDSLARYRQVVAGGT